MPSPPMPSLLSVQNLFDLDDSEVRSMVVTIFTDQLQAAPSVKATFFPSAGADNSLNSSWNDNVATALVCSSISRSSLHGFAGSIVQSVADGYWQGQLVDSNADAIATSQSLYDTYFPMFCTADGFPFQIYLNDTSTDWGSLFAAQLQENAFVTGTILKIISDDPNWLQTLNLALYKLNRLDSTLVAGVVTTWQNASPSSGIVANWQTKNYLPAEMFDPDIFINEVNAAIAVMTSTMLGRAQSEYIYGADVATFLAGKPASMGFSPGYVTGNRLICPPDTPPS